MARTHGASIASRANHATENDMASTKGSGATSAKDTMAGPGARPVPKPESTQLLMWQICDRVIPRSYRMMQSLGVRTFQFINAEGTASLERKPLAFPSSRSYCYLLQYPRARR
jgi:hypothetical protein